MTPRAASLVACLAAVSISLATCTGRAAEPERRVNSLGMHLVRIPPGRFQMGSEDGDWDERPVHAVQISQAFYMAATEVTNAQYERFDPEHGLHYAFNLAWLKTPMPAADDVGAVLQRCAGPTPLACCMTRSDLRGPPKGIR